MGISVEARQLNIESALRRMMESLGDEPFDWEEHDSTDPNFGDILRTTWEDLTSFGFVLPTTFDRYVITAGGWLHGLKITGTLDDPAFRKQAGQLSQVLKRKIKGRNHSEIADRSQVADEAALPEYFVYNAIDSHLLRNLFNRIDAYWAPDDHNKNMIEIPLNFGLRILR